MIQNWNKFNEGLKDEIAEAKAKRIAELRSILQTIKKDIDMTTGDVEQLVFNLLEMDSDLQIKSIEEGITSNLPELDEFHDLIITRPILYSDNERLGAAFLDDLKKSIINEYAKPCYCYKIDISYAEGSDTDFYVEDSDKYDDILKELESIKKKGATLMGGYSSYIVKENKISIIFYKRINKENYTHIARPKYYTNFPEEVRDEVTQFIIDNSLSNRDVDRLTEIINKVKK